MSQGIPSDSFSSTRQHETPTAMTTKKTAAEPHNVEIIADLEQSDGFAKGTSELLGANEDVGYHRSLGRRQIMMMTFGAGIGTGLYVQFVSYLC